ncbi:MAG TPA: prepilin-type N-terminal cleavage/methylation domain-containing protein [Vicinamibacterales bacterium]
MTSARGYTFIELIVVSAILAILASAIVPMTRVTMQRQREIELRRNLREVRTAIDKFKDAVDLGVIPQSEVSPGSEGYPKNLQQLVDGASVANDASGRRLKFLRRVPLDPMTNTIEWDLRAVQDDEDAWSWGGGNVFDIRTKSGGVALDGSKYRDW